jgi:LPS export ABC transporter protein LptC
MKKRDRKKLYMRNNSWRTYGCLLLILLVAHILPGCANKVKDLPSETKRENVPEEAFTVESYLSEGSLVKGKLTAPYMRMIHRADSPYWEFPRSLHVDFYNAEKVIESKLDALYGKYLQEQNKVYLRDSVVVKNVLQGDTLHSQELWWDKRTERFYTDKPVRIYTKTKILFGTGMEADQNFKWYKITHLTGTLLTSQNAMPK